MNTKNNRIMHRILESPQNRRRIIEESQLHEEDHREIFKLLEIGDMLRLYTQQIPDLNEDPVAKMLGIT